MSLRQRAPQHSPSVRRREKDNSFFFQILLPYVVLVPSLSSSHLKKQPLTCFPFSKKVAPKKGLLLLLFNIHFIIIYDVCMYAHYIILYYAGITDTAIGGQRIEEYMLNDTSLLACSDRTGVKNPEWNGRLYGKQTLPFVDMTVKGWLWYQVSE
jgi:hypothetical protein